MAKEKKSVTEILREISEEVCDHYCKYTDIWDAESEGRELFESEICKNCPMGRLP